MDRAFQRIRSLMLRGTFYSVPPKIARVLEVDIKELLNSTRDDVQLVRIQKS